MMECAPAKEKVLRDEGGQMCTLCNTQLSRSTGTHIVDIVSEVMLEKNFYINIFPLKVSQILSVIWYSNHFNSCSVNSMQVFKIKIHVIMSQMACGNLL